MKKIAIDFGTTNTLVASFEDAPVIFSLPDFSKTLGQYSVVPSTIQYATENLQPVIGTMATLPGLPVFSCMKRYIANKRDIPKKVFSHRISNRKAASDYLVHLINFLRYRFLHDEIDSIVFTVPVESFDTYRAWIAEIADHARIHNYQLLDESTAVALGYDQVFSPDYPYMIIDFGGGTLDVSIVRLKRNKADFKVDVLGKAGRDLGGMDIDEWLIDDFLERNDLSRGLVSNFDHELHSVAERLKIDLSVRNSAEAFFHNPQYDFDVRTMYTRNDFSLILKRNGFGARVQETLSEAVEKAFENGVRKRDISAVLLVVGSSQIPDFFDIIEQNFPGKVKREEPFAAVVRGAARFLSGTVVEDFLHHHYALEYMNTLTGFHEYETIVPENTKFPMEGISRKVICGAFSGQTKFALKVFEIASHSYVEEEITGVEFDDDGNPLILSERRPGDTTRRIPLNPDNPEFIAIDPPSVKGEERLVVTFSVNRNRMLLVDVWDMKTNTMLLKNKIVAQLK